MPKSTNSKKRSFAKMLTQKNLTIGALPRASALKIKSLKPADQIKYKTKLNAALKDKFLARADDQSAALAALLQKKPVDYTKGTDLTLLEYFNKYYLAAAKKSMSKEGITQLQENLQRKGGSKVSDLLELETPLTEHPLLGKDARDSVTNEIGRILGLTGTKLEAFVDKDLRLDQINKTTVQELINGKILTKAQGTKLVLIGVLAGICGNNLPLIEGILLEKITDASTLVAWDKDKWMSIFEKYRIAVPEGENDLISYAKNIMAILSRNYPDETIEQETEAGPGTDEANFIKQLQALWTNNDKLIYRHCFDQRRINWTGITAANKNNFIVILKKLTLFCNKWEGLGIRKIINSKTYSAVQKGNILKVRLASLKRFQKNNKGKLTVKHFDFQGNILHLNWSGISVANRKYVLGQFMVWQRILRMTPNASQGIKLLAAGFHSAMSIAGVSEDKFYSCVDLGYEASRRIYLKAKEVATISANYFEAIRDGVQGSFQKLAANNQSNLVNDLKQINGFDDLFGNQDYCDCEHCRSIFSPAAYFADLMYFIHEQVSEKYFDPAQLTHPLYLKNRRPDLWKIPLTCENTNTEIPYLQIVNEVLEAFLEQAESTTDVYQFINEAQYSTQLPVNVPIQELRIYLQHFSESLSSVFKTLKQPARKVHAEVLGMTLSDITIVSRAARTINHQRFGGAPLTRMPVLDFLEYSRITREELDQVLASNISSSINVLSITRVVGPSDIQKFHEEFRGLNTSRLDTLYRYLKFWKHTPYTWPEFELMIRQLKNGHNIRTLNSTVSYPKFLMLGQFVDIQNTLKLTLEEVASLAYRIPINAIKENQIPFYGRLFDLEKLFGIASTAADGTVTYNSTTTIPSDKTTDDKTALIIAGLGITEAEINLLYDLLGVNYSINITLNHALLSRLYKHALLARALSWTIEELVAGVELMLDGNEITMPDQIDKLIVFNKELKTSELDIAAINFIVKGKESTAYAYEITVDEIASMSLEFQQDEEQDDAGVYLQNYLINKYNITKTQLSDEYDAHLFPRIFKDPIVLNALTAVFTEDEEPQDWADFDGLLAYLQFMERWQLVFSKLSFEQSDISLLVDQPAVFGIDNLTAPEFKDLKQLDNYAQLLEGQEESRRQDIQDLYLQYHADGHTFNSESINVMADLWEVPAITIEAIISNISLSEVASDTIAELIPPVLLAKKLGVEGHSLKKLTLTDFASIKVARDIALGAIAAKYPDESERKNILEPYQDKINTIRRDALCDAIIGQREKYKFSDRRDLYNFFLLDVEMGGCFRTSRIVCANSSLQLYVHRCLLNLEQSDPNLNPSIPNVEIKPSDIPEEEWGWRKNYRVWEANRKIFLYPENYIDPALRDTKTGIFKELEDELLQEKISQESAEEAYKKYMARFSELTKLRFAGAYYHSIPNDYASLQVSDSCQDGYIPLQGTYFAGEAEESLYYLFARTNTNPYQFYYRTYRHSTNTWGNWMRMEVAIEAQEISSLVMHGKLYVFWNSAVQKEISKLVAGASQHVGYNFKIETNYAFLKEDGSWTTPQKTYLGQFTESESTILGRLGYDSGDLSQSQKDKRMDYLLQEFQNKVIRKPYALQQNNSAAPVLLYNIWTTELNVPTVTYSAGGILYQYASGAVKVSLPTASWSVVNGDFSSLSTYNGIAHVDISITGVTLVDLEVDCTINLYSATHCVAQVNEILTLSVGILTIPFPVILYIPLSIRSNTTTESAGYTFHNLSLSKNEILDADSRDLERHERSMETYSFLHNEYLTCFQEDGDFDHYIENSKYNFTRSYRKIHQAKEGDAHLIIPDVDNNLDTVSATTILTDEILDVLYARGTAEFLSLRTQNMTNAQGETFDMVGAYGEYYWEIFFHIPFLIASHLNANQKFKEAKWWYERIFNPTADDCGVEGSTDHYWQFREFRNLEPTKLQDILSDTNAIEAYKNDPFDPHAIARLRISAYQKAIVMKYIDNLIDWGDYLFTQDTREAITEAMQYYQLALDLLGKRPIKLGKCDTADTQQLTYENLQEKIAEGSEFLIALENSYWVKKDNFFTNLNKVRSIKSMHRWLRSKNRASGINELTAVRKSAMRKDMLQTVRSSFESSTRSLRTTKALRTSGSNRITGLKGGQSKHNYSERMADGLQAVPYYQNLQPWEDGAQIITRENVVEKKPKRINAFELVKESVLVFCVPENGDLMAYWDRVEDRMYKIRNCMNIAGVVRSLSLFAPPIDPNFLVRAAASGLSLEDILSLVASTTSRPAYRFAYLIEKARQFTQMVQSFGGALLAAMEKKDVEELSLLRAVHEQNILKLTSDIKKKNVEEAQANYQATAETLKNVQNRMNYYQGLQDKGLTAWETTQQVSRHAATALRTVSTLFYSGGGIAHLIPELGSPFSLKFGGKQVGDSMENWGTVMNGLASIADDISASAGLEATFQRREEEWSNQLKLASQEEKAVTQQLLAAELRKIIADKNLEVHEQTAEQSKEVYDFYKNKFTNLSLYDYLTANLNRLFREAYNIAADMAKLAEQAYQIETFDTNFFIANNNWESAKAGLLSGDRLLLQLAQMESAYIENNERMPEITQTFSLALLTPGELNTLRQTGTCSIKIPEIAFELYYPGQYRRLIKAVRLSIPAVVGPYSNVSAKLTLTKGEIKLDKTSGLTEHLVGAQSSISTSGGVSDSGMFDFNFNDQRYLPFEGAGAISEWTLELPANVRSFDYNSIADVLLTLSYTAKEGDRADAELDLQAELRQHASDNGMYKLISLRQEMPNTFHEFLHPESGAIHASSFELTAAHFPYFLREESPTLASVDPVKVYLRPKPDQTPGFPTAFKIATNTVSSAGTIDGVGLSENLLVGTAAVTGTPIRIWELEAGVGSIDTEEVDDILVLVKYTV